MSSDVERSADRFAAHVMSRRRFLGLATGSVSLVLLAACGGHPPAQQPAPAGGAAQPAAQAGPGGFSGGGSLKVLMTAHFIPAYDAWVDKWAADWGAKNKVEVTVDHILSAQMAEKNAAEVTSGSGHDMIRFTRGGEINLFNKFLVDVSDLAKQ